MDKHFPTTTAKQEADRKKMGFVFLGLKTSYRYFQQNAY